MKGLAAASLDSSFSFPKLKESSIYPKTPSQPVSEILASAAKLWIQPAFETMEEWVGICSIHAQWTFVQPESRTITSSTRKMGTTGGNHMKSLRPVSERRMSHVPRFLD